jgi:hypothetical protein
MICLQLNRQQLPEWNAACYLEQHEQHGGIVGVLLLHHLPGCTPGPAGQHQQTSLPCRLPDVLLMDAGLLAPAQLKVGVYGSLAPPVNFAMRCQR